MGGYLEELTLRLASGLAALPDATRARHVTYLRECQQPDGGFPGREGGSDLYYTGFALRSLAMLGELHGDTAEKAAGFLASRLTHRESVIELISLVYSALLLDLSAGIDIADRAGTDWRKAIVASLAALRRADGGYAKTARGSVSSTYHSFLAVVGLQLLGQPVPDPQRLVEFVLSQRIAGGAFREIRVAQRGGTNPTAAAVATLRILAALTAEQRAETIDFLASMQTEEGGLRANTRIPVADLLSTFTGLLTLGDLDAGSALRVGDVRNYVQACERSAGGFHGAAWDDGHDVEYTFYGLGCLGLLTML
jgi:geranylgeranyl transferase type-2 subunit beta